MKTSHLHKNKKNKSKTMRSPLSVTSLKMSSRVLRAMFDSSLEGLITAQELERKHRRMFLSSKKNPTIFAQGGTKPKKPMLGSFMGLVLQWCWRNVWQTTSTLCSKIGPILRPNLNK